MDVAPILIAFACLALGGVLKGATGAGAPVLAVPALAMMFDVRFAVVVMLVPNLLTNLWQAWRCRADRLESRFVVPFALAGAAGVSAGTFILASLRQDALALIVAGAVTLYIGVRLLRPDWMVDRALGRMLAPVMGFAAGMLQGASGLSAPISISFLNAMRLERRAFMATISIFFTAMSIAQAPTLAALGLLTPQALAVSAVAMVPIFAFMPVGAALARRLSRAVFDRVILLMLAGLAAKLLFDSLS